MEKSPYHHRVCVCLYKKKTMYKLFTSIYNSILSEPDQPAHGRMSALANADDKKQGESRHNHKNIYNIYKTKSGKTQQQEYVQYLQDKIGKHVPPSDEKLRPDDVFNKSRTIHYVFWPQQNFQMSAVADT